MIARSTRSPSARHSAAVVLAFLLAAVAGCDDSNNGGSGPGRLYFSTANINECMPMHVDVHLIAAGATVALRDDDSPDCDVDAALASAGCTGTFEVEGDGVLAVEIDGCEVPAEAGLFDCNFDAGDPAAIRDSVESACTCVGEPECHLNLYCLRFPEICVSESSGPNACEDCFNDIDDDDDSFVDCDDANCYIVNCGVGQTTITCSSTTTTTTTTL